MTAPRQDVILYCENVFDSSGKTLSYSKNVVKNDRVVTRLEHFTWEIGVAFSTTRFSTVTLPR